LNTLDPHIVTCDGIKYDYQHGCDVVFVKSSAVNVHLRLKKYQPTNPTFSEIDRIAIQLSGAQTDLLQIDRDGNHYLNTNSQANPPITSVGGYPFSKVIASPPNPNTEFTISLQPAGTFIKVIDLPQGTEGGGLNIIIKGNDSMFSDATGMCGKWSAPVPGLYDRQGVDMLPLPVVYPWASVIDGSSFGNEWQVDPTAPSSDLVLLDTASSIPSIYAAHPDTCVSRRRLGETERKLQQYSFCQHCMCLDDLSQRAFCEYDASIMGCQWVKNVPFYLCEEDTLWSPKGDDCCLRKEDAEIGYKYSESSNLAGFPKHFAIVDCEHDQSCFRKEQCVKDNCWTYKYCDQEDPDECFREYECISKCVRRIEAEQGYLLSSTTSSGIKYTKCPYNEDCWEKQECNAQTSKECYVYDKCDTTTGDKCFRDVKCPCSPTDEPSASPSTKPPSPGDPWSCDGCKWMHNWGKKKMEVIDDDCKIKVKKLDMKGTRSGVCKEEKDQCNAEPCILKYKIPYQIKKGCVKKGWCTYTIADAYTSETTSPPVLIEEEIKDNKGSIKEELEVKCECKNHMKLITIKCETKKGTEAVSMKLDYTCSECEEMQFAKEK